MIVRFATLCDTIIRKDARCNARSVEYTAWPTCRVCQNDVCTKHTREGTATEADVNSPVTVICINCDPNDDPLKKD
jgi:hypothetical protein